MSDQKTLPEGCGYTVALRKGAALLTAMLRERSTPEAVAMELALAAGYGLSDVEWLG